MRNNQSGQSSQLNNIAPDALFPASSHISKKMYKQYGGGNSQPQQHIQVPQLQSSSMPLQQHIQMPQTQSNNASPQQRLIPQYYAQANQNMPPDLAQPMLNGAMGGVPPYNNNYGYPQPQQSDTKKKQDPQLSVRNLMIGGLITFALILIIFAVIVLPPMMRPSSKSYSESAQNIESVINTVKDTELSDVLRGLNEFKDNITDEKFIQARNDLTSLRNSLNSSIVSVQGSLAIKNDSGASAQLNSIISKHRLFDQDLSVISNIYDALSPILANIKSFNATVALQTADDKVINKMDNDADTIANKMSGFNTSDHDVDLAFNQLAQAYKELSSATKKRFTRGSDATDAVNAANNDMQKFSLQRRGLVERVVRHRSDLMKALRDLSGYLEDKAGR